MRFLPLLLLLALTAHAAEDPNSYQALEAQYQAELELAGNRGAYSSSAYRLGFSHETSGSSREWVGNLLRALRLQEKVVKETIESNGENLRTTRPGNDLKTNGGLEFVRQSIRWDCRHCETKADRQEHRRATDALMELYDIEAAGATSKRTKVKFSGLPFFGLVEEKFSDPRFRAQTIELTRELEKLVNEFAKNPQYDLRTNIMEMALKITHGNRRDAILLAGLVISRDSNVVKYFEYLPKMEPEFVRAMSRAPLLIRLVTELDMVNRKTNFDRFSYDGRYAIRDARNYYYWSGALVSEEMQHQGFSSAEIRELNLQFPRHYKILRWWESQLERAKSFVRGKGFYPFDKINFDADTRVVMRMSAEGARMALGETPYTHGLSCRDGYEALTLRWQR